MDFPELTPKLSEFSSFVLSGEASEWQESRQEKDEFLKEHFFDEDKIADLEEGSVRQLVKKLWAFNSWTNKDYVFQQMIESGMSDIRDGFQTLFFGNGSFEERFDACQQNIRQLGTAGMSEILCHFDKEEYPIFNRRAKDGLVNLGVDQDKLPDSRQLSGSQYVAFKNLIQNIYEEINSKASTIEDLFDFDFFLYFLATQYDSSEEVETTTQDSEEFDHDSAIEDVLELGNGLGFDVEKEVDVAPGSRIDALWKSNIANLGEISYAFEVHKSGSRDSAIVNLQKVLRKDSSIQRVILISNDDELDRFKDEIDELNEDFRDAVGYFNISSLDSALNDLNSLKDTLNGLGLMNIKRN